MSIINARSKDREPSPRHLSVTLNTNHKITAPMQWRDDWNISKLKAAVITFALNKFQKKYKLSRKKLGIHLQNGLDLMLYFDDDEKVNEIPLFRSKTDLVVYVTNGEPLQYVRRPLSDKEKVDQTPHLGIMLIEREYMGSVIGKRGRRKHAIRCIEGVFDVVLCQNDHHPTHHTKEYSEKNMSDFIQTACEAKNEIVWKAISDREGINTNSRFMAVLANKSGMEKVEDMLHLFIDYTGIFLSVYNLTVPEMEEIVDDDDDDDDDNEEEIDFEFTF